MLDVVAPVDHKYVVPALEVSVTLPPAQNVNGPPADIVGVAGKAFTVMVALPVISADMDTQFASVKVAMV
jgi:hypothetical protein